MCVIVYKSKDVDIDMEKLQMCWEHNKDGAGLMFAEGGILKVAKGFMKWRSFKRYIRRTGMERLNALPVIFHFRIATHGTVSPRNCHPFQLNKDIAMVHNGVMQNVDIPRDEDISDSEAFLNRYVRDAFSTISVGALGGGMPINELFSKFIGGSKLAFMDNDGDVAIVNEKAGTWQDGAWHSNMLWKPYVRKTHPVTTYPTHPTTTSAARGVTGSGWGGPRIEAAQFGPDPDQLDEWYCFDCHAYFALGEARRIYWTSGMDRIVDCPECSGPDTVEVGEDMFDDAPQEDDHVEDLVHDTQWKCFDCTESFDEDSTVMKMVDGEDRCLCPFCEGVRTYEAEWQDIVDRFGASFFMAQTYDLTRGGHDAKI